jgi:hypothetical protein
MSNQPLIHWTQQLAGEIGGQVNLEGDRIHLHPASPKWATATDGQESIVISPSPENVEEWRLRLRYVEKAAAQAILSGPVGYSCRLHVPRNTEKEGEHTEVIRLAFGLSLSMGANCYRRYTAYHLPSLGVTAYSAGRDKLFDDQVETEALDLKEPHLRSSIETLLDLAARIEGEYLGLPQVSEQIETLNQSLSSELRALERFYTPGRGQYVRVLGNLDPKLRGEDKLDAEYSNKARDIIEKYQLRVIFRPLSLGKIHCKVKVKKSLKGPKLALPFVDEPLIVS